MIRFIVASMILGWAGWLGSVPVEARSSMYRSKRVRVGASWARQRRAVRSVNRALIRFWSVRARDWSSSRRQRRMSRRARRHWLRVMRVIQRRMKRLPTSYLRRLHHILRSAKAQDRRRFRRFPRSLSHRIKRLKKRMRRTRRRRSKRRRRFRLSRRRARRRRRAKRLRRSRRNRRRARKRRRRRLVAVALISNRRRRWLKKRRRRRRLLRRFGGRWRRHIRPRDRRHGISRYFKLKYPWLRLTMPLPGKRVGSGFGYRKGPFTGRLGFHHAVDIAATKGTPIRAAASGRVLHARWMGSCGKAIFIEHQKKLRVRTGYCHLSRFRVRKGQHVKRGQIIGYVGSTGSSTQPHLHFSLNIRGYRIDPEYFIR